MKSFTIIGAGVTGLSLGITLLNHGHSVVILESQASPGGSCRAELKFGEKALVDLGAAIMPMLFTSKFFRENGILEDVEFARPDIVFSQLSTTQRNRHFARHRLPDDSHAVRVLRWTMKYGLRIHDVEGLLARNFARLALFPHRLMITSAGCVLLGILAKVPNRDRALVLGLHRHVPSKNIVLSSCASFLMGLVGVQMGWPIPIGGSGQITDSLTARFKQLGGELRLGHRVETLHQIESDALILAGGSQLVERILGRSERGNFGAEIVKTDFLLSGPIPWKDACLKVSSTIHLGDALPGSDSEWGVICCPSEFDSSRAPEGYVVWAYKRLIGSPKFQTIEDEIEVHAPGFKSLIIASETTRADDFRKWNEAIDGGDILDGAFQWRMLLDAIHPGARTRRRDPEFRQPTYIIGSQTFPGPGIHGIAGGNFGRWLSLRSK